MNKPSNTTGLSWVTDQIRQLHRQGFYGNVVVQMRAGIPVLLRREETLKPPSTEEPMKERGQELTST